jgi:hypothetical protein
MKKPHPLLVRKRLRRTGENVKAQAPVVVMAGGEHVCFEAFETAAMRVLSSLSARISSMLTYHSPDTGKLPPLCRQ